MTGIKSRRFVVIHLRQLKFYYDSKQAFGFVESLFAFSVTKLVA